jgi:hypothetical protein
MSSKKNQKRKPKPISTKDLPGERRNGVLYLKSGIGSGCFHGINPTSSGFDNTLGSGQVVRNCNNNYDY